MTVTIVFILGLLLGQLVGFRSLFAAALLGWALADGLAGAGNLSFVAIGFGVVVFAVVVCVVVFAARRRFLAALLVGPVGLVIGASMSLSSGLTGLARDEVARNHNGSLHPYTVAVLQPARATVITGHASFVASRAISRVAVIPQPIFLGMARVVPAPPVAAVRVHKDGSLGAHGRDKDEGTALQSIVPEHGGTGWLFFRQTPFDGNVTSAVADPTGGVAFIVGPDCAGYDGCNESHCRTDKSHCFTTLGRIAADGSRTFMRPPEDRNGFIDLARIVPGRSGDLWP